MSYFRNRKLETNSLNLLRGVTSAPEFYQRKMRQVLSHIEGHFCNVEDILFYGFTRQKHYNRLQAALSHIQKSGIILNLNKCPFRVTDPDSLGHGVYQEIHPAVAKMR